MKKISIIGSTGSIGVQALDVAQSLGLPVCTLAAGKNISLLEQQARIFHPQAVAVYDEQAAAELKGRMVDTDIQVLAGEQGVCLAAGWDNADITLNAAVGIAGLRPTLAAIDAGKTLALANKESLVCGGSLVMSRAEEKGVDILPVDSEHSAIFQALRCGSRQEVSRLLLTASGGPFFGRTLAELERVTPAQALRHPSWNMGAKITIDSSTMMNKGFEVIEAHWLFGVPQDRIDVVVHRESVVHSFVEFCDGTVAAICSPPDMRLPIQYALTWPERAPAERRRLDVTSPFQWSFFPPDRDCFPALRLCEKALKDGGNRGAVVNGANEEAVGLFLREKIGYCDIVRLVSEALERVPYVPVDDCGEIFESDQAARRAVRAAINQ